MKNIITYDLECSGLDTSTSRIVQIAYDLNGKTYNHLVNPTIPIPPESTLVHRITDDDVSTSPTFKELSEELYDVFNNSILIGYNSTAYDNVILTNEFKRCGLELTIFKSFDVYLVWVNSEKTKRLGDSYKRYCGKHMDSSKAHSADYDLFVTKEVFKEQLKLFTKEELKDLSQPFCSFIIDEKFAVGKYKDKLVKDIYSTDTQYIKWVYQNTDDITKSVLLSLLK